MANEAVLHRLRWHAGLDDGGQDVVPSIAECTWRTGENGVRLSEAVQDFLLALSDLNIELNGPVPSESVNATPDIPRAAAYGVAEVTRMLREMPSSASADERQRALDAAWTIETAWLAVLAGDIDDLTKHVTEERLTQE